MQSLPRFLRAYQRNDSTQLCTLHKLLLLYALVHLLDRRDVI